jgi:hypothetical protein
VDINHFLKTRKSGSISKESNKEGRLSKLGNNHGGLHGARKSAPARTLRRPARKNEAGDTGRGVLFESLFAAQELNPAASEHEFAEIDTCRFIKKLHQQHESLSDTKLAQLVDGFPAYAAEHIYPVKMGSKITIKIISDYWNKYYKWIEAGRPAPKAAKAAPIAASKVGATTNGWHEQWRETLAQEIADPANQTVKGDLESLLLQLDGIAEESEAMALYGKVMGR